MFVWIVTGDNLSQLIHCCRTGRIIQEYAGDNLIYQKKTLAELTMKKHIDKSLLCFIQNILRYTTTLVHKLTSIIVIDRILSGKKNADEILGETLNFLHLWDVLCECMVDVSRVYYRYTT